MDKIKFLPYQADWIRYTGRFALAEKSRRTGITFAEAYRMTSRHIQGIVKGGKSCFSSADLSASEEYIDYVEYFAKVLNTASTYMGNVVIDEKNNVTAHRVTFPNGQECNAISSNPRRFRSKGGDITLDEFAHHEQQEKMFTASKPSIMWGNDVRIISTHNGDGSYFNNLIKEIKKGVEGSMKNWKLFTVPIDMAIEQGLVDAILKHKATDHEVQDFLADSFSGMTQESINEEFYCQARSTTDSHLLSYELINPIQSDNILSDNLDNITGDLYVGVDIGRNRNFTIIWIDEKVGDILYCRKFIPLKNMRFRDQKEVLYDVLNHPNMRRCCIDATGLGMNLAEDAVIDFSPLRVEAITMTNSVENELATDLYVSVEDRKCYIPHDKRIRDDFYSLKCVTTSTGKKRFDAPTAEDGSHADYFWAKALANHAAKNFSGPLIVTSGGKRIFKNILQGF